VSDADADEHCRERQAGAVRLAHLRVTAGETRPLSVITPDDLDPTVAADDARVELGDEARTLVVELPEYRGGLGEGWSGLLGSTPEPGHDLAEL